jgi:hypothetical protein
MSTAVYRVLPNISLDPLQVLAALVCPFFSSIFPAPRCQVLPSKPMLTAWWASRGFGSRAGLWQVLVTSDVLLTSSLTVIDELIRASSSLHPRRRPEPLHLQGMLSGSRARSLSSIPYIHFLCIPPSLRLSIEGTFSQVPRGLS